MRVYVAASSQELDRATWAMDAIRAVPGLELAHDWTEVIRREGSANRNLGPRVRGDAARDCLARVTDAHVCWLLAPKTRTSGAWFEFSWYCASRTTRPSTAIASGDTDQSIFCSLADYEFTQDERALAWLMGRA